MSSRGDTVEPTRFTVNAGGPSQKLPLAGRLIQALADCLPELGTDNFTERFLDPVQAAGVGQVTAFAYKNTSVACLLRRNFASANLGRTLAAKYLDGWYREDPLFERVIALQEGDCAVEWLDTLRPRISPSYLSMFFCEPGFRTKVAVLVVQDSLRLALNLYFENDQIDESLHALEGDGTGVYRLLGRTLATHFLRLTPPDFPLPLTVLSERERQVCVGMLAGKKAEIIAGEIGVEPSSVVTYRRRAYQKLGITSRGQLFSVCRA